MQPKYTLWLSLTLVLSLLMACKKDNENSSSDQYTVSTLVGGPTSSSSMYQDGPASSAVIKSPRGIAIDQQGNVYVGDGTFRIRKITAGGEVSTLAGSGKFNRTDGQGINADLGSLGFLSFDAQGNLYASSAGDLRKITPSGMVSTVAIQTSGYEDGPLTSAKFGNIQGIAVDPQGNIYVADEPNHRIRKITPGGIVSTFAGSGPTGYLNGDHVDGPGNTARFKIPHDLAIDLQGNLYVTEKRLTNDLTIRKITPAGIVSTLVFDIPGTQQIGSYNIAIDGKGNMFVTDDSGFPFATRVFNISPSGTLSVIAGTSERGYVDGVGSKARFMGLIGIAADGQGNLYVADSENNAVRKISRN